MTLALQPDQAGESVLGEAEALAKVADVHVQRFAQNEQTRKSIVRYAPDDILRPRSHNANMARKAKEPAHYDKLRKSSGWYAAAWRDYRQMTLQDVADALGSSKGQVSDLETGAKTRFNRDWLEQMSKVFDVAAGDLIDTNPFSSEPKFAAIRKAFPGLDDADVSVLSDMAEAFEKRKA